jgi:hypothetical protein
MHIHEIQIIERNKNPNNNEINELEFEFLVSHKWIRLEGNKCCWAIVKIVEIFLVCCECLKRKGSGHCSCCCGCDQEGGLGMELTMDWDSGFVGVWRRWLLGSRHFDHFKFMIKLIVEGQNSCIIGLRLYKLH